MSACVRAVASMLLLAMALLLSAAAKPPVDDAAARRLLPGLWRADQVQDAVTVRATSEYRRDGFVVYAGRITGPGVDLAYRVRSRWTLQGGVLATEIVESNQPELLPVGSRKRDTVISIDARRFRYRDEQGGEHEETRVATP